MTLSRLMLATALFGTLALPAMATTHATARRPAAAHVTAKPILKGPGSAVAAPVAVAPVK